MNTHTSIVFLLKTFLLIIATVALSVANAFAYNDNITHDVISKKIKIEDSGRNLAILIDYSQGCKIAELHIKGENILSESGVHTGFRTRGGVFSSTKTQSEIIVESLNNKIILSNLSFGDFSIRAYEKWIFEYTGDKVLWTINREYSNLAKLEDTAFPQWNFADLSVWKGGIIDNGGMVWCKYLANINDTYGIRTGGVTFWNPDSGNALRINANTDETKFLSSKYSHSENDEFTLTQLVTDYELEPRYNLNRFVSKKADVFSPFDVKKGGVTINLEISYVDYPSEYSRGKLPGIDADAVRELMNTTGRYGVVDNGIVGANGWTTNWKCLHEPFFAQIGMALNDENYTRNMGLTLDRERDYAITDEGRVLSRWHSTDDDQIRGTFNYKTGYYEAVWGYTMDSQTGYIINTAEQFDLCGDLNWLRSHKTHCEKVLDWMIMRDSNNNGIFEMMNNNVSEMKGSDWLDIVWAGFENAFVNAQMYEALNLWAACEVVLGDREKSQYYLSVASKLKESFNKSVSEGGFWYPEKKQYIYWRDKDNSIHGDNFVTPINFAAIAFGLCDDKDRISIILDDIEKRTSKENLFHWPLCFESYKREEVHRNNWPFPRYENGDIFPTWGYLGVRAYVNHDRGIALKYIHNILEQYKKDGLSSQRYSRETQLGLGTDILAGICTSVTALYRDIYGVRPKWNRMGLEPNMIKSLNGTEFNYNLRNTVYNLRLNVNDYEMRTSEFSVRSKDAFGASFDNNQLSFYPQNKDEIVLKIKRNSGSVVNLTFDKYTNKEISWKIASADEYLFSVEGLDSSAKYEFVVDNKKIEVIAQKDGNISFSHKCIKPTSFRISKK